MKVNLKLALKVQDLLNKLISSANDTNLSLSPKKIPEHQKKANVGAKDAKTKNKLKVEKDDFKRQKTELPKTNKNYLKPNTLNLRSESRGSSVDRNSEVESKISTESKARKRDLKLQKVVVKPLNLKPLEIKLSDEDYERLKEQVVQEVCKSLKLSIIELEELTDFQKLIQNKIKRLAADVHGKAAQAYAPYTTKSKDSKGEDLINRSFEDHIIAPTTTVRISNGGGPMNQFHKNINK